MSIMDSHKGAFTDAVGAEAAVAEFGPTVLVVEDDWLVLDMIAVFLAEERFRVLSAPNADAAARLLETEPVDVLFTDIDLGAGPDGLAVARAARAVRPDLKVVYASGRRLDLRNEATVPDSTFLPKPYRPVQVCALLDRLVGRRHAV